MPLANPGYFHLSTHIIGTMVFRRGTFTSERAQRTPRSNPLKKSLVVMGIN